MNPAALASGVIPVLETPFQSDGAIDRPSFARVVAHAAGSGVSAVMYPGYASEMLKLADCERQILIGDLLAAAGRGNLAVLVSIPDHATRLAVQWADWAVEQGAAAINILPPYLLNPRSSEVRDHLAAVLQAVAPLPAVIQFAPHQTGTALRATDLAELAAEHSNLIAVKIESTPPSEMIGELSAVAPGLSALVGYAGLFLPEAIEAGAVGVQPGASFLEVYVRLWGHHQSGEHSQFAELHQRLRPFLEHWMSHVELIVAAEKAISFRRGLISAPTCRAPGYPLDEALSSEVQSFITEFADELTVPAT